MLDSSAIVRVRWHGAFRWESPSGIIVPEQSANLLDQPGLYQVYGHHVVFGPNSLLYIGMTDRSLRARLADHESWLAFEADPTIRIGVMDDAKDLAKLQPVEALTIWWHSPPYNSKNIWDHGQAALWVQNHGARGSLQPEYTTEWADPRKRPNDEFRNSK